MNIVAFDLSLSATGCMTDQGARTIRPPKLRGMERLDWLRAEVCNIVFGSNIDLVVMEGYAFAKGNQAHQMGELGGVIRLELWNNGMPYVVVPPAKLKKFATGRGNADKQSVLIAAVKDAPSNNVTNDNEADAFWLFRMAHQHYSPIHHAVPKYRLEVVESIEWPEIPARKEVTSG